ncbi:MAG: hypothetical protein NTZ59_09025 [Bacteroidetes bacterium]|nr:hypothetical protein [Bacteroidota bacterium]
MKKYLEKFPELQDFLKDIDERIYKAIRPPEEVILDEFDFCSILKISKRLAAKLRAERLITYYKSGGKLYYKLSDVLSYATSNKIPAIVETLKIR